MTKKTWIEHIAETHHIPVPSKDTFMQEYLKDLKVWRKAARDCKASGCAKCAERNQTRRANAQRAVNTDAMHSIGMTRVRGNLGGTYWE